MTLQDHIHPSFPHAVGGNPVPLNNAGKKALDARLQHSGMTKRNRADSNKPGPDQTTINVHSEFAVCVVD
ncbi:hypothetical protein GCM10011357_13780 [Lacimicrobium alkaliphilum]|uniref:Uncharacterized protein n=1 Tax=Lacimicrobium alkaliphilum TaxID=1526571 RepID=A0ABQ1RA08_9ALTE|nr:hypothetical protein GCM10011357_13780 [Lacimicrobium alkaliphilum]